tara:strand:+ start:278 stop:544 length:267 start_codon:yes stop_codon:yes gene_type:complete
MSYLSLDFRKKEKNSDHSHQFQHLHLNHQKYYQPLLLQQFLEYVHCFLQLSLFLYLLPSQYQKQDHKHYHYQLKYIVLYGQTHYRHMQ